MQSGDESCLVSVTFFIRNFLSENYMKKRKILSSGMQLPFFVNAQFWASGDNLDLKYAGPFCLQRILNKKESGEVCVLIWTNFDSFANTYLM